MPPSFLGPFHVEGKVQEVEDQRKDDSKEDWEMDWMVGGGDVDRKEAKGNRVDEEMNILQDRELQEDDLLFDLEL